MGLVEGAIIGGAIGAAVSIAMLLQRSARKKKLIKALGSEGGIEAARELLDGSIKPLTKIPLAKILDQRERMAGLAMLGDVAALEAEVADHYGALTAVAQVGAIGLLGLAVRGDAADAARQLDELATRMETEGGRAMALVKKKVRAVAHLASGVAGQPIPVDKLMAIEGLASDGGMVQLLVWHALSLAMGWAGKQPQAEGFANKVRRHTRAFDAPASAAAGGAASSAATSDGDC